MGWDLRNTSWSAMSTPFLQRCHDQPQTTIFSPILWLLDNRRVGIKIALNPLLEIIINNTFLIILVPLFLFLSKERIRILSFSLTGKRWAIFSPILVVRKKNDKKYRKIFYFFYLYQPLGFPPTNWTELHLFQLVRPFYNKTVKFFKNNNLIVYFLICQPHSIFLQK